MAHATASSSSPASAPWTGVPVAVEGAESDLWTDTNGMADGTPFQAAAASLTAQAGLRRSNIDDDSRSNSVAQAANASSRRSGTAAATAAGVGIPGLSPAKWDKFLELLNSPTSSSLDVDTLSGDIKGKWILDSGCYHHMTSKRAYLSHILPSHPYTVTLPNGSKTTEM